MSTETETDQQVAVIALRLYGEAEHKATSQVKGNDIVVELPDDIFMITTWEELQHLMEQLSSKTVQFDGLTLGNNTKATFICLM
ncbi:MAG: hypothetical protein V4611_04020 [Patescibacteria group bacterium]